MGWSSGSELMNKVIFALNRADVSDEARLAAYRDLIPAFEDADWDTQDESEGLDPAFDEALRQLHPDWFEA